MGIIMAGIGTVALDCPEFGSQLRTIFMIWGVLFTSSKPHFSELQSGDNIDLTLL